MCIVAQALGLLSAALCFVGPFFKKKYQMLLTSLAANLFVAVNTYILEGFCTAVALNTVAMLQIGLSLYHIRRNKPVTTGENILFLAVYVGFGLVGFRSWLDLLPLVGAVLFMLGVFQRDEQKTRLIGIGNTAVYLAYYAIIGSTSVFAQVVGLVTNVTALCAYGKKGNM